MRYSPLVAGVLSGIATPLVAVLLQAIGFVRCLDTPTFLNPISLVIGGVAVGIAVGSAMLLGSGRHRAAAITGLFLGSTLLGIGFLTPPYRACGPGLGPSSGSVLMDASVRSLSTGL
jgi:hypothetical protein